MTRKITLSVILVIIIIGCYKITFGNGQFIRQKVASVRELDTASKSLEAAASELEKKTTTDYDAKKDELTETIQKYEQAKDEYETLVPESVESLILDNELKDIYDVDFLWTIIGNYATETGINLRFDVVKNTTSALSLNNTSDDYIVCDLKFNITGNYISLTDFIQDLEDDDRLGFEINDFEMKKSDQSLLVTLAVKEIKINTKNLIDSDLENPVDENSIFTDMTEVDSNADTTDKTNATNTTTNTVTNTSKNTTNKSTTSKNTQTINSNTTDVSEMLEEDNIN